MPVRVLDKDGYGRRPDDRQGHPLRRQRGAKLINLSLEFSDRRRQERHPATSSRRSHYARARGRARRRRRRATRATRSSPTPRARATCCRSARPRAAAAWPSTRTTAAGSTSSRPAAATTPTCPTIRTATTRLAPAAGLPDDLHVQRAPPRGGSGCRRTYEGTSMAAPHVTGIAALAIASGVRSPTRPRRADARLEQHGARPRRAGLRPRLRLRAGQRRGRDGPRPIGRRAAGAPA